MADGRRRAYAAAGWGRWLPPAAERIVAALADGRSPFPPELAAVDPWAGADALADRVPVRAVALARRRALVEAAAGLAVGTHEALLEALHRLDLLDGPLPLPAERLTLSAAEAAEEDERRWDALFQPVLGRLVARVPDGDDVVTSVADLAGATGIDPASVRAGLAVLVRRGTARCRPHPEAAAVDEPLFLAIDRWWAELWS